MGRSASPIAWEPSPSALRRGVEAGDSADRADGGCQLRGGEATLTNTYWGTIADLHEVVAIYRAGQITPEVERFSLDNALEAYRKLEAGELSGRAVVTP